MRNYSYFFAVKVLAENIRLLSHSTVIIILVAATIIDIREHRIPDKLVLAGAVVGLVFPIFDSHRKLVVSLAGGMAAGLVLIMIYYITKGGLGLGDVKLFGCVGIYLGFENTISAMLIAAILSGLYSLVLICINGGNKNREIPFAPFILAGTLAVIVFDYGI